MNTAVATPQDMAAAIENVLARGDLSLLTAEQRVVHYHNVCRRLGLNPDTQPFRYMPGRDGKLGLYPSKDCTDQLRKINAVSIAVIGQVVQDGVLIVTVSATDKTGRKDEDFGAVAVAGLRGQAAADAYMKAMTKAKRRVTLSISGLGLPDSAAANDDDDELENDARVRNTKPLVVPSQTQAERSTAIENAAKEDAAKSAGTSDRVPDVTSKAEAANVAPYKLPRKDDSPAAWSSWASLLMVHVRAAPDADVINEWTVQNADHFDALQKLDTGKHTRLIDMIENEIKKRTPPDDHIGTDR